jgi:asparagine synthase (glutamine-hydrolysing)
MCGISGVINFSGASKVTELIGMNDIINYRGPDDEGFVLFDTSSPMPEIYSGKDTPVSTNNNVISYFPSVNIQEAISSEFHIAFGHRRLSILDISPYGHQPMCDQSGNYWITYNGEIYNYLELKAELELEGHTFKTHSDTEVILVAYKHWGIKCQEKFNGMWAFAIYNIQEQTIFLSRDRFGIKPLYYWFSPTGNFYFGSEIKQFTIVDSWEARLNFPRAYDYLFHALTDHTDETMFQGVFHLPPGSCILLHSKEFVPNKQGRITNSRWYEPSFKGYKGSFEDAKLEFREHFKSAVELHLRSDVPVGSALSGGLDSSAIVSYVNILLREESKAELQKTFSSCSEDKRYDEKIWMDEVIRHTKVEAHFVYPRGENVLNLSEKIIWHQDEPYQSQSAYLGYHVFEKAKENGVTVLLNGQGADEYLSGYSDFRILRLRKLIKSLHWKKLFLELGALSFFGKILASFKLLYHELPLSVSLFFSSFSRANRIKRSLFSSELLDKGNIHPFENIPYKHDSAFDIAHHQLLYEPLQKYLRWEDRNSMAHSVEARVPFLDYRLIEFTTQLPLNYLDGKDETKKIMIHSLDGILPEVIKNRKDKKGFITPEQRWFTKDLKAEFMQLFEKNISYAKGIINEVESRNYLEKVQAGTFPFDYTYWRIISFCLWMKVFNVKA